jgi:hypothetical protein
MNAPLKFADVQALVAATPPQPAQRALVDGAQLRAKLEAAGLIRGCGTHARSLERAQRPGAKHAVPITHVTFQWNVTHETLLGN